MPQLKNAEKALRQSVKRQARNLNIKDNIAFLMKQAKRQASAKDTKLQETVKAAMRAIDKASQRGILKMNTAARQKSRLVKSIKALQTAKK